MKLAGVGEIQGGNEFKLDPRVNYSQISSWLGRITRILLVTLLLQRRRSTQNAEYFTKCVETLEIKMVSCYSLTLSQILKEHQTVKLFKNLVLQKTGKQVFAAGEAITKKLEAWTRVGGTGITD